MGTPMFLCVLSFNLFKAIGGNDGFAPIHTMIYTYILQQGGEGVPSLLDALSL
jgi:ABC-type Fe3+ transport system permease subunit